MNSASRGSSDITLILLRRSRARGKLTLRTSPPYKAAIRTGLDLLSAQHDRVLFLGFFGGVDREERQGFQWLLGNARVVGQTVPETRGKSTVWPCSPHTTAIRTRHGFFGTDCHS